MGADDPTRTSPDSVQDVLFREGDLSGAHPVGATSELPAFARRLTFLTFFRIGLVTVLLVAAVVINLVWGRIDFTQAGFGQFILILVGVSYALCVLYILLLPRSSGLESFGLAQIAGDLAITSFLVHATGGAISSFGFLYPLVTLAAAVLFLRRGALLTALASGLLFVAVSLVGYTGLIPPLSGQVVLPWELARGELVQVVGANVAACFAVGILGSLLGGELRRARAQVEAQEHFIRDLTLLNESIVRSLPSGLISTDKMNRVRSANEAAYQILGRTDDSIAGKALADISPSLAAAMKELAQSPTPQRKELTIQRPRKQTMQLELAVSPLQEGGKVVGQVLSFQDVTDVRRMEHLAGIGRISAAIAHELRNPLASISGSIELLRGAERIGAEEKQLMGIVLREVSRLSGLVDGLLQYSRPQQPHLAPIDLGGLVNDVVRMVREDSDLGIAVTVDVPGAVRVDADASQLRQVIWNLVRNAVEASVDGSPVEVLLRTFEGKAAVSVRDRGVGISAEARERLFEPFYTTKERGTGLGLAIAKSIVEKHGGLLEVDTASGRGSTFTIYLDLATSLERELDAGV